MKFKLLIMLLFAVSVVFAQRTELETTNRSVPLFPGCVEPELRYDCFVQSVGAIVLDSVNGYHKKQPVPQERIEVNLMLFTTESGDIEVRRVKSANSTVEAIAKASLQKLPKVIPIYRPEGTPATCSVGFVLVLVKDTGTGLFRHDYKSMYERLHNKTSPIGGIDIIDAVFPECVGVKAPIKCFEEKFTGWLLPKLSAAAVDELKKDTKVIRLTIDEEGGLLAFELFGFTGQLQDEVVKIMPSFPKVAPSTVDGNPYMATYVFPVVVK
ncbi:hypothetical protein AM493_09015 [Flavobacterium akiainvivens]|uniref:TonB C-terminal domain-containing protein n=1 Tax=Flavobacterium akiainvivens TaxID=1202724 RepID=A0A0N0RQN8_9FLAO|nr:hypothetical protein [Flavobacterium akiainvivens]KOS06156.1 hypothetical protein AM493_09015 [Flavobacterium akiainvivens]SFQ68017.1 hypothetical protein SAMN05444144_11437 [Flavobacterium akiainvivens]